MIASSWAAAAGDSAVDKGPESASAAVGEVDIEIVRTDHMEWRCTSLAAAAAAAAADVPDDGKSQRVPGGADN